MAGIVTRLASSLVEQCSLHSRSAQAGLSITLTCKFLGFASSSDQDDPSESTAYCPALSLAGLSSASDGTVNEEMVNGLLGDWNGLLWNYTPKKRKGLSHRRHRHNTQVPKNRMDIDHCLWCGEWKEKYASCIHCTSKALWETTFTRAQSFVDSSKKGVQDWRRFIYTELTEQQKAVVHAWFNDNQEPLHYKLTSKQHYKYKRDKTRMLKDQSKVPEPRPGYRVVPSERLI
eukprot:Clim_evm31s33 gene=Clim_evmTU31s33